MKMTEIDTHVATRLRSARLLAKKSQEQAAEALGITFQQVQKYEKGVNRISVGRLIILLHLYGQPLEYALSGAPMPGQEAPPVDDPGFALSSLHGGAELARALVSMKPDHRRVVAIVAEALR